MSRTAKHENVFALRRSQAGAPQQPTGRRKPAQKKAAPPRKAKAATLLVFTGKQKQAETPPDDDEAATRAAKLFQIGVLMSDVLRTDRQLDEFIALLSTGRRPDAG